jgi:hypothetical protein
MNYYKVVAILLLVVTKNVIRKDGVLNLHLMKIIMLANCLHLDAYLYLMSHLRLNRTNLVI